MQNHTARPPQSSPDSYLLGISQAETHSVLCALIGSKALETKDTGAALASEKAAGGLARACDWHAVRDGM